jgi:hypothetical protein
MQKIFLITLVILSTSCSHRIKVHTPSARFMSPEASGKTLGGEFQIMQQSGTEGVIYVNNNEIDNPMQLSNTASPISMSLNVGIMEKFDVLYYNYSKSATMLGLKYQILGKSRREAQAGNQSLAVTVGVGGQNETTRSESEDLFSSDIDIKETEVTRSLSDLSLIYGYRLHKTVLAYSSFHVTRHTLEAKITSNDTNLNGKTIDQATTNYGLALGLALYSGDAFKLNLEASAQRTDWTKNDPTTFGFFSAALGWIW